tara:strand:+ start:15 stop:686 length:672 start_codon:yes stop_codon:yes gene_type:complete
MSEPSEKTELSCCTDFGLQFNETYFENYLRKYRSKGLPEQSKLIFDYLVCHGINDHSILEIGSGAGALHMNLVNAGAKRSVGVDASEWASKAAESLKAEIDPLINSITIVAEFSKVQQDYGKFSVVIMDRSICCYPDLNGLLRSAIGHSTDLIAISIPRKLIWIRLGAILVNMFQSLLRKKYRIYVHAQDKVDNTFEDHNFKLIHSDQTRIWQIAVYQITKPK